MGWDVKGVNVVLLAIKTWLVSTGLLIYDGLLRGRLVVDALNI